MCLFYNSLYADELALFSVSRGPLQRQLECLSSFFKQWHLIVNLPKTKIMLFTKRNRLNHFTFDGKPLKIVQGFKPSPTIALKCSAVKSYLFSSMVVKFWQVIRNLMSLKKAQFQQLKFMIGVRTQIPTLGIYADTSRFPLHLHKKFRMIKYWLYILRLH